MATLTRHCALPSAARRVVDGPVPSGTFWALKGAHDLPPGPMAHADLTYLLKVGAVWMTDAHGSMPWQSVTPGNLPRFTATWADNYDGCTVQRVVTPFMPQFYFVPRSARGHRFIARATARAYR